MGGVIDFCYYKLYAEDLQIKYHALCDPCRITECKDDPPADNLYADPDLTKAAVEVFAKIARQEGWQK